MPAHIVFYGTLEGHLRQPKASTLQENPEQLRQYAWDKGGKVNKRHSNIPSTGHRVDRGQRGKVGNRVFEKL